MSRIDEIMDSVGSGMKVLLMDSDTTTSVSLSCPQSRIMKKDGSNYNQVISQSNDNLNFIAETTVSYIYSQNNYLFPPNRGCK